MTAIDEVWDRLELALRRRAPDTLAALNPPAEPAAIDALEKHLGRGLPADLRASLLRHDGFPVQHPAALPVDGAFALLDVASMGHRSRHLRELAAQFDAAPAEDDPLPPHAAMARWWWRPEWVVVASPNWDGALVADEGGAIIRWSSEEGPVSRAADSFTELLAAAADTLEA